MRSNCRNSVCQEINFIYELRFNNKAGKVASQSRKLGTQRISMCIFPSQCFHYIRVADVVVIHKQIYNL